MKPAIVIAALAASATAAAAEPLTIPVGESWAFAIENGEPVKAHKIAPATKPAHGEIKATVSAMAGTAMTLTNNSSTSYSYRAELVGASGKSTGRTCVLPAKMVPALEYWPHKARAVRLGNFRATDDVGSCPSNR